MTRPALASWAGESGSADPEAALEQAVCLFCASFSGVHNPAQHIPFLLWPSLACSGQEPRVPPALWAQGQGEEGGGRPELPETPKRLEGSLLGSLVGAAPPCSYPAETKPRLAQPQEEGSLGTQAGPERRLSASFLSWGICGTATRQLGGGWSCSLSIFSAASLVPPPGARGPPGMGTHVDLLGGEGADAHACGVGLDHTVDLAYVLGRDAQAGAHAAHRAVGGRHEGVGPCETEPAGLPPHRSPGEGSPQWPQGPPMGRGQHRVCMSWWGWGGGGPLGFGQFRWPRGWCVPGPATVGTAGTAGIEAQVGQSGLLGPASLSLIPVPHPSSPSPSLIPSLASLPPPG